MLGKITTGKKVEKLDCLSIAEVVDMDVEMLKSSVMMNSWGVVTARERNDENWLRNVEKGWEYGDGGGGR